MIENCQFNSRYRLNWWPEVLINWYSNSNKKTVRDHPLNRHNLPPQVSRNFFLTNFLQVWCIFQQVEIVSRKQFCQMLYKEPREETFSWKEGPAQTKETTCLSKTKGTWDKKEGNIGKRTKVLAKYDVTVYKTEPDENLPPFTCKKTTATVGWRGRFLARWSWLQRFCCSRGIVVVGVFSYTIVSRSRGAKTAYSCCTWFGTQCFSAGVGQLALVHGHLVEWLEKACRSV